MSVSLELLDHIEATTVTMIASATVRNGWRAGLIHSQCNSIGKRPNFQNHRKRPGVGNLSGSKKTIRHMVRIHLCVNDPPPRGSGHGILDEVQYATLRGVEPVTDHAVLHVGEVREHLIPLGVNRHYPAPPVRAIRLGAPTIPTAAS